MRFTLVLLAACLSLCYVPATLSQQAVGSVPGTFDVNLAGSATYAIPIKVAPGTVGMEPKLAVMYDSQAPGGSLGAGWTISGISTITRGPKNARDDGIPDGVRVAETDALYLDGQRLIQIRSSGAGVTRAIEFRKEVDDQTRIVAFGSDLATARFVVNTKGGISLIFETLPSDVQGESRGDIRLSDGAVLLRAETRAVDSSGNYMDFYYRTNSNGNYDISRIRYTGHLESKAANLPGTKPYAEVEFVYDVVSRPLENFVGGRPIVTDTRLNRIVSRLLSSDVGGVVPKATQVARYSFEFEDRVGAARFVLRKVRQFGEDDTELTPTIFSYTEPTISWGSAPYSFPAVFADHQEIAAGYRFVHVSSAAGNRPDLLYSTLTNGQVESFAYQNNGASWTPLNEFKPPLPFARIDGADLGVLAIDVNGDGRADLLQSYQLGDTPAITASYVAGAMSWEKAAGFELPFVVSRDGARVARVFLGSWSGGPGPDLLFQSGASAGFLRNTPNGWVLDATHKPPVDLTHPTWLIDAKCNGGKVIISEQTAADGKSVWKVYEYDTKGWSEISAEKFAFPFSASVNASAIRELHLDGSQCSGIIVSTAQNGGLHAAFQASSAGWKPISSKTPPFDLVDAAGRASEAIVASVRGSGLSDVVAHRVFADGRVIKFTYFQTASGWESAPEYTTPELSLESTPNRNAYVSDFLGDGKVAVVIPENSRQNFGQIFVPSDSGFVPRTDFLPPVPLARHDQQDLGVRLVDLNGDQLPDLLWSRVGETASAWINTGSGWVNETALAPPVPFAGDDISGNPAQFVDIDGDGNVDVVYHYRGKTGTVLRVFRNVGADANHRAWQEITANTPELSGLIPPADHPFAAAQIGDLGVRFVDLGGTGRPYMLVGFKSASAAAPTLAAYRSDGTRWIPAPEYAPPVPFVAQMGSEAEPSHDLFVQTVDVDADGLPDFVAKYHDPSDPSKLVEGVWLNTGHGWKKDDAINIPITLDTLTWDAQQGLQWQKNSNIQWADVNGDGLADIVYTRLEGTSNESVTYLSTGRGWVARDHWMIPTEALANRGGDPGLRIIDVNGDGYPDLLYARVENDGSLKKGLLLNTGYGWASQDASSVPDIPFTDKDGNDQGTRLIDLDGRGLVAIVQAFRGDTAQGRIALNRGHRADVLARIDAGYGLTTDIVYQSLSEPRIDDSLLGTAAPRMKWLRVYSPGSSSAYPVIATVPPTYVVRRVVVGESTTRQIPFSYRYGDYRLDALSRRALGFAWRESVNESSAVVSRIEMSHNIATRGRVTQQFSCWLDLSQAPATPIEEGICKEHPEHPMSWLRILTVADSVWNVDEWPSDAGKGVIRHIMLGSMEQSTFELDGKVIESAEDTFEYDDADAGRPFLSRHLNVTRSTTKLGDGSSETVENQYAAEDEVRWLLGRLTKTKVTKAAAKGAAGEAALPQVRVASFSYFEESGLLKSETANANTDKELTTSYERDIYGNIIEKHVHGADIAPQEPTLFAYDGRGRFELSVVNPLKHKTQQEILPTSGLKRSSTDENGIRTAYEYDGFGRLHRTTAPSGGGENLATTVDYVSLTELAAYPISGVDAAYGVRVQTSSGVSTLPPILQLVDSKGRTVRTINAGFSRDINARRLILQDTQYDLMGGVVQVSLPYEAGKKAPLTAITRDILGRPIKQKTATGRETRFQYSTGTVGGAVVASLELRPGKIHRIVTKTNMRHLPIEVSDEQGSVRYVYDAGDRPLTVTDPIGATTHYHYDAYGNRVEVDDPDAGTWKYEFDSLGRVVAQTDVNSVQQQRTTIEYDAVGRVTRELGPDGVWTWDYDRAPHGVGKPFSVQEQSGRYAEQYSYDAVGRPREAAVSIGGESYVTGQTYDTFGRIDRVYYPAGFSVIHSYDAKGFLRTIADEQSKKAYWTRNETDAFGHITSDTLGNGVRETAAFDPATGRPKVLRAIGAGGGSIMDLALSYDIAGNLKQRTDSARGISETFGYDALDRLVSLSSAGGKLERYTYDAAGRLKFKSDIGTYRYNDGVAVNNPPCPTYWPRHALWKVENAGATTNFSYDCHGNLRSDGQNSYTYSADNRLVKVERALLAAGELSVSFEYDANGNRYRERARHGARALETISVGRYERVTEYGMGGNQGARFVRHRWYLTGPNGTFAVAEKSVERFDREPFNFHVGAAHPDQFPFETRKTWYVHRDQLGSVLAITDETGTVRAKYWYDPWGARRQTVLDDAGLPSGRRLEDSWARGFLGQQHLDDFQLVHLNGRVYDPRLGFFGGTDPVNQAPLDTQQWSAYGYARSNPLRYVDRTGYDFWGDAWHVVTTPVRVAGEGIAAVARGVGHFFSEAGKWVGENWRQIVIVAAVIVVTVATAGTGGPAAASLGTAILSGMAAGATAGALGAALYGGSFEDVLAGAIKGGVIGAFSGAAFYGVGTLTAGGGTLHDIEAVAGHGVVGGARESLEGGSFWDGFKSGALAKTSSVLVPSFGSRGLDTARAAAVGGAVASIGGGNFANGAITGAFSYAFNDAMHPPPPEADAIHPTLSPLDVLAGAMVSGAAALIEAGESLLASFSLEEGAVLAAEEATSSSYVETTIGSSVRNFETNVTPEQFSRNLIESGYEQSRVGPGSMLEGPQGQRYFLRETSRSGPPTADYYQSGSREIAHKLRLGVPK